MKMANWAEHRVTGFQSTIDGERFQIGEYAIDQMKQR